MFKKEIRQTLNALVEQGLGFCSPAAAVSDDEKADGTFTTPYYPPERHGGHSEIICLLSGSLAVMINGVWKKHTGSRPLVFLKNTEHSEHFLFPEEGYSLFWLTAAPDGLNLHLTSYDPASGYAQSGCRKHVSFPRAGELWRCAMADKVDKAAFAELLIHALRHALNEKENSGNDYLPEAVSQVKNYIEKFYWRPLDLRNLGDMTHYAPAYLNQEFRRRTGEPVYAFLMRTRLEHACRLLEEGDDPVKIIARAVGFRDPLYFSRVFKKHTGSAPLAYRKERQHRTSNGETAPTG